MNIQNKVDIFSKYFTVRNAYGSEHKKIPGKYMPACGNFFTNVCPKKTDKKARCSTCDHKSLKPVTREVIAEHITGKEVHQFYLLRENNMIRVGAIDFDNKDASSRDRQYPFEDIAPFCQHLQGLRLPFLLTRSSYSGHHLYIYFKDDVDPAAWHSFCEYMFKEVGYSNRETYPSCKPEIFPKQIHIAKEGNGNGLTLPMIEPRMKNGHSCIVDGSGQPVKDQWETFEKVALVPNTYFMKILDKLHINVAEYKATRRDAPQHQNNHTPTGRYTPPISGDTHKILAGCEALKKFDEKFKAGYVPGYTEGFAVIQTLQHTQNGRRYIQECIPGWHETGEQIQEINHFLEANMRPMTCETMIDKGLCAKTKDKQCFQPVPPKIPQNGIMVPDTSIPKDQWPQPSPVRFSFLDGKELFNESVKELEEIAKEKNEEKRCKDFETLLRRIQSLGEEKLKLLYDKAKALKIAKPRQVNNMVRDAEEAQVEDIKKNLEERSDRVHVQGTDYLKKSNGGYNMLKFVRGKPVETPLSDCEIKITHINRYISEDRDDEVKLKGYAQHGKDKFDFEISSKEWHDNGEFFTFFGTLLVGRFNILKRNCDPLRQAALAFSQLEGIDEQTFYTDPGWLGDKFIMPTLVIDKDGITENKEYPVKTSQKSHDFASQIDFGFSSELEHKEMLQHILNDFVNCWPRSWTLPSLSHTLLPPLLPLFKIEGDPRPTLVLEGKSGSGKTELGKFLQRFYGHFNSFIGVTGSTGNGLRAFSHAFKDSLMLVDDYKNLDERERKSVLDLVQSTYNQARNVKLNRDSSIKKTLTARGLPLVTGEQFIDGHSSIIGRSIIIETHHHDTNVTLDKYEEVCNRKDAYNTILPRFLHYALGLDWTELRSKVMSRKRFLYNRVHGKDNGDRIALNLAVNEVTLHLFADYCLEKGAIDEKQCNELKEEHTKLIGNILEDMCQRIKEENSSEQFLDHFRELVVRDEVVIKGINEKEAERKPIVGFLKKDVGKEPVIMLFPKSVSELTQKHNTGKAVQYRHTPRSLAREMYERGMLANTSEPGRLTVRTHFNGHRIRCWPMKPSALGLDSDVLAGGKPELRVASSGDDII